MNINAWRVLSGLVLAMLVPVLMAQPLVQPPAPPTLKLPTETTLGTSGSQLRQVVPAPSLPSDPAQRPASAAPVPDKGPANALPLMKKPVQPLPAVPTPAKVIDAQGKPVRGALQVAPDRIYNPATGRYHWTTPSGQHQKIID